MIKLYGVARSRASRNIWLMKEAGIPFDRMSRSSRPTGSKNPDAPDAPLHTRSKAFLAINPNGHVPTLDDDGFVIHESLAINLYLARKMAARSGLRDIREDSLMTMWAIWAVTECRDARDRDSLQPRRQAAGAARRSQGAGLHRGPASAVRGARRRRWPKDGHTPSAGASRWQTSIWPRCFRYAQPARRTCSTARRT